jgi:hypothetical protein
LYKKTLINIIKKLFQAGYELQDKTFYEIMELCFDETHKDAIYSKQMLVPEINKKTNWNKTGSL